MLLYLSWWLEDPSTLCTPPDLQDYHKSPPPSPSPPPPPPAPKYSYDDQYDSYKPSGPKTYNGYKDYERYERYEYPRTQYPGGPRDDYKPYPSPPPPVVRLTGSLGMGSVPAAVVLQASAGVVTGGQHSDNHTHSCRVSQSCYSGHASSLIWQPLSMCTLVQSVRTCSLISRWFVPCAQPTQQQEGGGGKAQTFTSIHLYRRVHPNQQ